MTEYINSVQTLWQPKLIRLTQIGLPELENGNPTVCFIDPKIIIQIYRTTAKFKDKSTPPGVPSDGVLHEELGQVTCTAVVANGGGLHVIESPEEVMRLRESAYGHQLLEAVK